MCIESNRAVIIKKESTTADIIPVLFLKTYSHVSFRSGVFPT